MGDPLGRLFIAQALLQGWILAVEWTGSPMGTEVN